MKKLQIGLLTTFLLFACNQEPELVLPHSPLVSVYPNPCREVAFVHIDNSSAGDYSYSVFHANGKTMLTGTVAAGSEANVQVFLRDEPDGVYHVSLETAASTTVVNFLKVK